MTASGFYHCSAKGVGRAKGRSVVAAAAYRSGERLVDSISGQTFDYRARGGVAETFILARADAPTWAHDRERLWNEAERATDRANARIANEFVLGLPHELDEAQRKQLVKDFLAPLIEKYGVAVDVAIHEPGQGRDARNHHAHVLVTHRELGPDGFGEIANTRVKTRKRKGELVEERVSGIIAAVPDVFALRKNWEQAVNRAYERAGLDIRVDHRSHDDRGLDQKPTIHLGPTAAEIERRRPGTSELGDINRKIVADNDNRRKLAELEAEERNLSAQIIDLKAERAMRDAYARTPGHYDRLDKTHSEVARGQHHGRYDELKAATPPPEIVRQFDANANRTAEPAAPIYDRDADNAAWDAKIEDSAKDAAEAHQRPADRAATDIRANAAGPAGDRQNSPEAQDTRPLGKTASDILMAWTLSRSAGQFEEALAAKGLSLAVVSRDEAEQSHRTATFAKELGNFAPTLKAGEIVAVNEYGTVHRFTQRNTGEAAPDIETRFPGIDRAALLDVADTKDVMREASRAAWQSEERQRRDMDAPLTRIEMTIADALANTMTGTEFAAALDEKGLTLARVTSADVQALDALREEAAFASLVAHANDEKVDLRHFAPVMEGETVAVTGRGDVFRLNPKAFDFEEVEQRLADTQARLPSVVEARAFNEITREQRGDDRAEAAAYWAELRAANADAREAHTEEVERRQAMHEAARDTYTAIGDAADFEERAIGKFSSGLAAVVEKVLSGIFSFFGAWETKLTPMQAEMAARAAEERAEIRSASAADKAQDAARDAIVEDARRHQQEEFEREAADRERQRQRERDRY